MTARKLGSDEQFEYQGPKTKLDQLFDHHGYSVYEYNPELGAEEEEDHG